MHDPTAWHALRVQTEEQDALIKLAKMYSVGLAHAVTAKQKKAHKTLTTIEATADSDGEACDLAG